MLAKHSIDTEVGAMRYIYNLSSTFLCTCMWICARVCISTLQRALAVVIFCFNITDLITKDLLVICLLIKKKKIFLLYAGCFSYYSRRHRLSNIFPRFWQYSWAGYYLSPWWLFLSYLL